MTVKPQYETTFTSTPTFQLQMLVLISRFCCKFEPRSDNLRLCIQNYLYTQWPYFTDLRRSKNMFVDKFQPIKIKPWFQCINRAELVVQKIQFFFFNATRKEYVFGITPAFINNIQRTCVNHWVQIHELEVRKSIKKEIYSEGSFRTHMFW